MEEGRIIYEDHHRNLTAKLDELREPRLLRKKSSKVVLPAKETEPKLRRSLSKLKRLSSLKQVEEFIKEKQDEEVFSAKLSCSTYSKFIFIAKINYLLFPLSVFFFVVDEGLQAIYFRFIAGYDSLLEG